MRRMCFSSCSTLPNFSCLGWTFSTPAACPRLSGFWESFSKMVQLLLSTRLGEKTHFDPVIDYMYEKSCLGDSVMAPHTGKEIWHLCHPYQTSCHPCVIFQKLSRNLSLCRLRGEFSGFENLCALSMNLDHSGEKGRCLIWIKGCREAMDKLWGMCFPKLWALQKLLAHKRWVAANQSFPRREAMPTHMLSLCICQALHSRSSIKSG